MAARVFPAFISAANSPLRSAFARALGLADRTFGGFLGLARLALGLESRFSIGGASSPSFGAKFSRFALRRRPEMGLPLFVSVPVLVAF